MSASQADMILYALIFLNIIFVIALVALFASLQILHHNVIAIWEKLK